MSRSLESRPRNHQCPEYSPATSIRPRSAPKTGLCGPLVVTARLTLDTRPTIGGIGVPLDNDEVQHSRAVTTLHALCRVDTSPTVVGRILDAVGWLSERRPHLYPTSRLSSGFRRAVEPAESERAKSLESIAYRIRAPNGRKIGLRSHVCSRSLRDLEPDEPWWDVFRIQSGSGGALDHSVAFVSSGLHRKSLRRCKASRFRTNLNDQ